ILVPTLLPFSFTPPPPSALSTLSLHDALPICAAPGPRPTRIARGVGILLLPCHRGLRPRPEGIHESQTQSSQWSVSRRDNVGNLRAPGPLERSPGLRARSRAARPPQRPGGAWHGELLLDPAPIHNREL